MNSRISYKQCMERDRTAPWNRCVHSRKIYVRRFTYKTLLQCLSRFCLHLNEFGRFSRLARPGENAVFVANSSTRGGHVLTSRYLFDQFNRNMLSWVAGPIPTCSALPPTSFVVSSDGVTMASQRISESCFNWRGLCTVI